MVKRSPARRKQLHPDLDAIFLALADPTRRAILHTLRSSESSVSELAAPHSISMPAVMKHLNVLERAGLVSHHKTGRIRRCQLVAEPMAHADRFLADYRIFWEQRLDALGRFLEAQDQEQSQQQPRQTRQQNSRSTNHIKPTKE